MTTWFHIFLPLDLGLAALIQALSEFLPISSSLHLKILEHFLPIPEDLDIVLHGASLLVLVTFFWSWIIESLKAIPNFVSHPNKRFHILNHLPIKRIIAGVVTILPLVVMTLLLKLCRVLEQVNLHTLDFEVDMATLYGVNAIIFGCLMIYADTRPQYRVGEDMNLRDMVFVGLWQLCSLLPGASRSGTCLTAMRLRGFKCKDSLIYTFWFGLAAMSGAMTFLLIKQKFDLPVTVSTFLKMTAIITLVGFPILYQFVYGKCSYIIKVLGIYRIVLGVGILNLL